jgi:GMP synthase-like glutamine amidotransferase
MKPIAIFQHTEVGAPGSVISILEGLGMRCGVVSVVTGEAVPKDARAYAGLIFMGGYMGVHDSLPWIKQECALMRQADAHDIPVAGHCLGSQLLAFAFGANVRKNVRTEIGWQHVVVEGGEVGRDWWGEDEGVSIPAFQWHSDTFDLPRGAVRIGTGVNCENQAFVLRDMHLAMQSHFEMTPELVALSLERNGAQLEREFAKGNPAVTSMEETRRDVPARTRAMTQVLTRLYSRWVQNCKA